MKKFSRILFGLILTLISMGMSLDVEAAVTGSALFDRTVYPVPWGTLENFGGSTNSSDTGGNSVFPVNVLGISENIDNNIETVGPGDVTVHVRIIDDDFNISEINEDIISQDVSGESFGPVKIIISRASDKITLGYAGGNTPQNGTLDVGDNLPNMTRHMGSIHEISPNSGIFQFNFTLRYTDGPSSSSCPKTINFEPLVNNSETNEISRFDESLELGENFCIQNGDTLTVEYTDPMDANGSQTIISDSSVFDLRNGTLVTDKDSYFIEDSAILTLIDPDLDLNSQSPENYSLDLLAWKSNTASLSMGTNGGNLESFNPIPVTLQETGSSTGIFQTTINIPEFIDGNATEGLVTLEYQDWNPNSSNFTGIAVENITKTISVSIPLCTPEAGNWAITSSCKIDSDVAPMGNVTIQNSSLVTITSGNSLTVSSGNNITIKAGSGLLIKSGGALKINS